MKSYSRDEIRTRVIKLIHDFIPELQDAELTEDSVINTDTNIDSLSLIMLITKVESTFDIRIPRKQWTSINTLKELLDKIEELLPEK
ncbi:MAG: acyl carrier protein [Mogibacterium sp.]|nr:acyl carrier protein [Mogibacterium sp.]MBR2540243.1 acyl carrier protein [Mogibacterium sp.]